ncbi:MAG: zinc-dependent alcohol dehydrogenase family protein [Deltaproteobacteria bacterium]
MKAMLCRQPALPLELADIPRPEPAADQVLVRVLACGVCRTDLHIVDGELPHPGRPVIPGHEIVGIVEQKGANVTSVKQGQRVGIPWLGQTCGKCFFCQHGMENLCDHPAFTGYTLPGGYAEYTVADPAFCFPIPERYPDAEAAPLLCAGLIGYRSLRLAGSAEKLGLYGFGAAAHILAQITKAQGRKTFAFTRPGKTEEQEFARSLGADWAAGSDQRSPELLDAAIIFAPVGELVVQALKTVRKGGRVVCAGIHMSDIPSFPYRLLWGERQILSVANLTRQDGIDFFEQLNKIEVKTTVHTYPLAKANEALSLPV